MCFRNLEMGPDMDLFTSLANHRFPQYLMRDQLTSAGELDTFQVNWGCSSTCSPFNDDNASACGGQAPDVPGKAILITPLPWCMSLLHSCPNSLFVGPGCLDHLELGQLKWSLNFHAWSFSGPLYIPLWAIYAIIHSVRDSILLHY